MTNGRGAGMASFMTKKKKYKFQVDVCLEELLEVPFVSAVLFAKLRLLDGGNFQDHSSREEVRDHTVKWGARFSFPCKMMANASTGVLERCVLRISVRKECKGGRSFTKLGFVDLNLAEYAGAGETFKKALLEGYDTRHRQDNSMLRFSIKMNMLSGDILFKVPSPSLKHKQVKPTAAEAAAVEENSGETRTLDEFSGGSLGGSIASGSSGFGSLPKKRPPLLSSELVIGHTLTESNMPPVTVAIDGCESIPVPASEAEEVSCEQGHSRNSSNTSQMSKASGYSSIHSHSHSRQSSSGDSGHIRDLLKPKRGTAFNIPSSFPEMSRNPARTEPQQNNSLGEKSPESAFSTPKGVMMSKPIFNHNNSEKSTSRSKTLNSSNSLYHTPKSYHSQLSNSSADEYKTPDCSTTKNDWFPNNFVDLQKSYSCDTVAQHLKAVPSVTDSNANVAALKYVASDEARMPGEGVLRSKSDFQIPHTSPLSPRQHGSFFNNFVQKSDNLIAFLTPLAKRRAQHLAEVNNHSTPKQLSTSNRSFKMPSPIHKRPIRSLPQTRTASLTSLQSGIQGLENHQGNGHQIPRSLPHRKLLEGNSGGKLAPLAISPDEAPSTVPSECSQTPTIRRPSVTTNPSSSSLGLSETGSLDRAKAALERRKKAQVPEPEGGPAPGRVEVTRVNPDDLISELIKNTNLEQSDESAETSGLQLFIAKDGTAALGNHEVKSQMSTGLQGFKQVVMEDNR